SRLTFGHNATVLVALLGGATLANAFSPRVRALVVLACLVGIAAIAVTFDRAAYLALLVAVLVVALRHRRRAFAWAAALIAAAASLHPAVRSRFASAFSG